MGSAALTASAGAEGTFTLDGKPSDEATVRAQALGGCDAGESPSGITACFSTVALQYQAVSAALKRGTLPPGFTTQPSPALRDEYVRKLDSTPAPTFPRTSRSTRAIKAHKADNCSAGPTFVAVDTDLNNKGQPLGYFYSNGVGNWSNHTSFYRNEITSYWNSYLVTARWHDDQNGQGAYYNLSYPCRQVSSLANGAWNDRFESFASW